MSAKGILKAGNKIQTNLSGASNYDLRVGGVNITSATSSVTLGPYDDDQFYELIVSSGLVSVSCYDALTNSITPLTTLDNLGVSSVAGDEKLLDNGDLVKCDGSGWGLSVRPSKRIVLNSSVNGNSTKWLFTDSSPERFGFLLTGTSATVSLTGSDDGITIASGYAATITMDTAGSTFITPLMNFDYKFIKFTITALGASSSIQIARGM